MTGKASRNTHEAGREGVGELAEAYWVQVYAVIVSERGDLAWSREARAAQGASVVGEVMQVQKSVEGS